MPYCYDTCSDCTDKPRREHEALDAVEKLVVERDKYRDQVQAMVRELCAIADTLGVTPDYNEVMAAIRALKQPRWEALVAPLTDVEITALRAILVTRPRQ